MLSLPATSVTGHVVSTSRLSTSRNGNPRYSVELMATHIEGTPINLPTTVTIKTAVDSGLAYGITNPEYLDEAHTFDLDKHGSIKRVRHETCEL